MVLERSLAAAAAGRPGAIAALLLPFAQRFLLPTGGSRIVDDC